ncbi:MAG: ribonuclease Y [Minisyncoccales bacterium]
MEISFLILFVVAFLGGYLLRKEIAKRDVQSLENKIKKRTLEVKEESERILLEARQKANELLENKRKELEMSEKRILEMQGLLLEREKKLLKKEADQEKKEKEIAQEEKILKEREESLKKIEEEKRKYLEEITHLSAKEAKEQLFQIIEKDYQNDFLERINKLKKHYQEQYEKKAKEILTTCIERIVLFQIQNLTTTVLPLPSEEIKGRIIGKEGRNIRTFENLTGVNLILDETPETVVISSFNPLRRYIAKRVLEKLIQDGRIQPARIEEIVKETEKEIDKEIEEIGENVAFEMKLVDLPKELIKLLGKLKFRTSYGQNALLHSMEVAYLAEALAQEIGADALVAKKAGLFHDIGKISEDTEGSHIEAGIKILEKYNVEKEVILAMRSHHEDYPALSLEAIIVKTADQISGARPGARKDTVEDYLKRIGELEKLTLSFPGVEKAWALQAGREIRIFVKPEEIDDLTAEKLAREIARKIASELHFPWEVKVVLIREKRIVEYAK